jgi:hypothetical protein
MDCAAGVKVPGKSMDLQLPREAGRVARGDSQAQANFAGGVQIAMMR